MKKTDIAYYAGLFDGEGCILIRTSYQRNGNKKGKYYSLSCKMGITNRYPVESICFAFGGSIHEKHILGWKTSWNWHITTRQAYEFLKVICPYLKIKKFQAELAIKFCEYKWTKHYKKRTDEERALEEAQKILLQEMKKSEA